MAHADHVNGTYDSREEMLQHVIDSYEALATDTTNWVANLANCSSLLWHGYHAIGVPVNWTGFYVQDSTKQGVLVLGPFQGKVACQLIEIGKGVCGTAASTKKTQVVPDVDQFPGHIACDGDSRSEIVVPLVQKSGETQGVIDIDCLVKEGFSEVDQQYLERLAKRVIETCKF